MRGERVERVERIERDRDIFLFAYTYRYVYGNRTYIRHDIFFIRSSDRSAENFHKYLKIKKKGKQIR